MIRLIIHALVSFRNLVQNLLMSFFDEVRDPETGKIRGFTPNNLKMVVIVVGLVFFMGLIAAKLFIDPTIKGSGQNHDAVIVIDKYGF